MMRLCTEKGFEMALRYWFVILVLGSAWGTSFLFNEILLREVGPLTVSFGRVALGAIGCWIYAIAKGGAASDDAQVGGAIVGLGCR